MCKERRAMIGKANMEGKEPKSTWSANLSNGRFILLLIALISSIWGSAAWMTQTAQTNFDHRLLHELSAPEGSIYTTIQREICSSHPLTPVEAEAMKGTIDLMKRQDVRSNQMLERVYTQLTGEQPPPRVTE